MKECTNITEKYIEEAISGKALSRYSDRFLMVRAHDSIL